MLVNIRGGRVFIALVLMAPGITWAAPSSTGFSSTAGQDAFDNQILSTDLGQTATVTGTTPSLGGLAGLHDGAGSPVAVDTSANLNNDAYFDGSAGFGTSNLLASSPTVIYSFNTGVGGSATGYSISGVNSINGWHDHASFSDQDYKILYSTVANPTTFLPLITVAYNPFDPANDSAQAGGQYNSSLVNTTDSTGVLASGVAALEFTFTPYSNSSGVEQSGQVVREIDVTGVPTAVPEPASCGLIVAGLAVGLKRRRKDR